MSTAQEYGDDKKNSDVLILEYGSLGFVGLSLTIPMSAFAYQLFDPMNLYIFYVGNNFMGQLAYVAFSALFLYNQVLILNVVVLIFCAAMCTIKYWVYKLT
jgi:hypothetical protein